MGKPQGKKKAGKSKTPNDENREDPDNGPWVDGNLQLSPPDVHRREPYFAFNSQGNNRPRDLTDGTPLSVITLLWSFGQLPPINILSVAMLMEMGMTIAYYESRPPSNTMLVDIQQAAWDCVVYLRTLLERTGSRQGLIIRSVVLPARVITGFMHSFVLEGQNAIPWNYYHELFFNTIIWIIHGHVGSTIPEVIRNGNILYETYYSLFEQVEEFRDTYAADLHPVGTDPISSMLQYRNVDQGLVLSPTARLRAPRKRSSDSRNENNSKKGKKSNENLKDDSDYDENDNDSEA